MMTSMDNRIDALIRRIKAHGSLPAFQFIPGFPPHKTPAPVTCYTVAVSNHEARAKRVFIGNRSGENANGQLYRATLQLRVYAPERTSGSALLRACAMVADALEAEDSDRLISELSMSGIGFDTAARSEYRDVTAVLEMLCEEAER